MILNPKPGHFIQIIPPEGRNPDRREVELVLRLLELSAKYAGTDSSRCLVSFTTGRGLLVAFVPEATWPEVEKLIAEARDA